MDPASLRAAAGTLAETPLPAVNSALLSPAGFDTFEGDGSRVLRPVAEVRTTPHRSLRIAHGRTRVGTYPPSGVITPAELAALRDYAAVRVPFGAGAGPVELAALLRQLLVAGVPVLAPDLPLSVRRLLGRDLGDLVAALTPAAVADVDRREHWSVDARRLALLTATSAAGVPSSPSAVTAVVEAGSGLTAVLRDLRAQTWPNLAVVVAAGDDDTVPARLPAGIEVVRAATRADAVRAAVRDGGGELATVVTPELSYGPEHVRDLVLGYRYGQRPVAGTVVRRTYLEPLDLTACAPGEPTEAPTDRLSARTLLAAASTLLELLTDGDGDLVTVGDDGYAIHDRNVHRTVRRGRPGLDAALHAGGLQVPGETGRIGWLAAESRRAPSATTRAHHDRVDPAYLSYFARIDAAGAASAR
ncbi:hypothetical protein [Jiangella asiatica]|uniref:Uncharacterized protein n=1 Tax=Jiangella asiatica TaxID=2530372 RepID=A0A4R5DTZ6_9ACTN|nr:hypothetical protein [Jiangella asiatica]TDE15914.1 hypothetical protein E1269_01070 [Jiangella asiatica]